MLIIEYEPRALLRREVGAVSPQSVDRAMFL